MRRLSILTVLVLVLALPFTASAAPAGQMTRAVHISLAPTWFDPAETPGLITPFVRTQILTKVQPIVHDRHLVQSFAYSAPYEDLKLESSGK